MPNETKSHFSARRRLIVVAISACFTSAPAWANPTAPQVVKGAASFNQAGKLLTISNSNGAIINWNSFSIGAGETTRFNQASAASSVLNRVVANDPSVLLGTLSSNGKVWLVNPAGIMVGQGAKIDVAGFIASTLNVRNEDFLAGRLNFGATPNAGRIENYGQISTPSGGSVFLVAPNVENHGIINAPNGEVILAAGQTAQLIDTGTPGVKVDITGAEGDVTNLGQVVAEAGRIGMAGVLVKNSGTLNASSVVRDGGRIFLKASRDAYVDGAGRIVTTGTKGGSIAVLGKRVAVMDQAQLDASGNVGGGSVLVGGDYQGKNPEVQNANVTYFGPEASIKVDAKTNGCGGRVIVWADDTTRAHGTISAKGGAQSGVGGFVETSGHRYLDVAGIKVTTDAVQGKAGQWLLDPSDISIVDGSGYGGASHLDGVFSTADSVATVYAADINNALNTTNVSIQTSSSAAEDGDITVTGANIANSSGTARTLTLRADRSIAITGSTTIAGNGSSTVSPLGVTLHSAYYGGVAGGVGNVTIDSSTIATYGGAVIIGGGANPNSDPARGYYSGLTSTNHGVYLNSASISTGGGALSITGVGGEGGGYSDYSYGIYVNGSTLDTSGGTGGKLTLSGTGGGNATYGGNVGVYLSSIGTATIITGGGNLDITGVGGMGNSSTGITLNDETISTYGGNVTLDGRGGSGGYYNAGVSLQSTTSITTGGGGLKITGVGGDGGEGRGIVIYDSTLDTSKSGGAGGAIELTGTGGTGVYNNVGADLGDNTTITTGGGALDVMGTGGGTGSGNYGIRTYFADLDSSNVSAYGNISLKGNGAYGGEGLYLSGGAIGAAGSSGNVALIADSIFVDTYISSTQVYGGALTLEPYNNATTIGLRGGAGTLSLDPVLAIASSGGFLDYVIGKSSGTGLISVGPSGWTVPGNANLALQNAGSGSAGVSIGGALGAGGSIKVLSGGDVTLAYGGSVSSAAAGDAITLSASEGNFVNNSVSVTPLSATAGRWLVYSSAPASNTLAGMSADFKRYNCTYAGGCLTAGTSVAGSGNGLLYAVAPFITVTPDVKAVTYGNAGYTGTLTGSDFIDGDTEAVVSGVANFTVGGAVSGSGNPIAGTHELSYAGGLASSLGYQFRDAVSSGNELTVIARALSISATGVNKVYDGQTSASVTYADNRVTGDVLAAGGSASFLDKNVGTAKTVNVSGITLTGTDAGNYSYNTTATTAADITARALTVSASGVNKVYDGLLGATAILSDNRVAGDALTIGNGSAFYLDKNVGVAKNVNVSGIALTGTDAGNYSFNATAATSADITARALSVTAAGVNKVYDGLASASVTFADNRVTGDVLTASGSASYLDKNVGVAKTVNVSGIALTGTDAGNYSFNGTATASADITARALTVSATGVNKVYDGLTTATVTYADNRVTGDVFAAGGSASFLDKNAGAAKTVNVSGIALTGTDAGNYSVNITATTSADITPATLSLSGASAANKVYDATTSATLSGGSLSGLFGSDVVGVSGTGVFADKNVGTGKTVNLSNFTLTGTDAGNYVLSGTTASTTADIVLRPFSTWVGGASGNWSLASNWDALPDLSNVQSVSVPAGTTVTYDAAAGSTNLASLTAGGLTLAGGSLNIADGLKVSSSFSLNGGTLAFGSTASADITQASGNLTMPAATLANLALAAPAGAIAQSGAIVATNLKTLSQTGATLTDAGNKVANFTAANSGGGNIAFTNAAVLTLGDISNSGGNINIDNTGAVTTIGAVSAPAGAVSILAHSPLTIGTGGVTAAGNITLGAGETTATTDKLTLDGVIQSTGSGSTVTLSAGDDLAQNANVTTNGGAVNATAQLGNISMALGTTTSTGGGNIGYTATSGSVVLASLNAGSGGIALNAGGSIQAVPGSTGANLISGQAAIVAGGDLNLLTQVTKLDVDVGGKFTITDLLTGAVMSDVPAAEPLPTSSVPVLEQVLSTVTNTTEQQQPGQTTTQPPPPPPPPPAGGSGPNLLSSSSQTIGGTEGTFGGSAGGSSSSSGTSGTGEPGQGSGASQGGSSDKPAGDKPSESKTEDKSASAKTDEGKDGDKKDDKKEDDKKKEEESTAKKDDKPAPKKLATCS